MILHFPSYAHYTRAVELVATDPIGRDDLGALTKLASGGLYPVEPSKALADVRRHRVAVQSEYSKQRAHQAAKLQRRALQRQRSAP